MLNVECDRPCKVTGGRLLVQGLRGQGFMMCWCRQCPVVAVIGFQVFKIVFSPALPVLFLFFLLFLTMSSETSNIATFHLPLKLSEAICRDNKV